MDTNIQKYKYLLKNVGLITISNFSSKILTFILVPLYTNVLSTEEYGLYDMSISIVQLMLPFFTLNIVDSVLRFLMDKTVGKGDVISISLRYTIRSYLFILVIFILCFITHLFPMIDGYEIYLLLYYVTYSLHSLFANYAKGLEDVSAVAISGMIGTFLMLAFNILFLLVINYGLSGFYLANILAAFVQCVYLFFRLHLWKMIQVRFNTDIEKKMIAFSVPLIFSTVGYWVNGVSDRYVVAFVCGTAATGLLSVAYKIPSMINVLQSFFSQAWQISAIKEYSEGGYTFYENLFGTLNLFMSFACSVLIMLSRPLAGLLYAKDFYKAWMYVPFLLVNSVVMSTYNFLTPILSAKKSVRNLAISSIAGALTNIFLNFVLVYNIGIQGATISTVVSNFIICTIRRNSVREVICIKLYIRIVLSWLLLSVQAGLESYTDLFFVQPFVLFIICMLHFKFIQKFKIIAYGLLQKIKHS